MRATLVGHDQVEEVLETHHVILYAQVNRSSFVSLSMWFDRSVVGVTRLRYNPVPPVFRLA